jgi:hypothetical protein
MSVVIKSGASTDALTVDATSKAARVTLYASDGTYDGEKATYRASTIIPLVVAVTADRAFFVVSGSATTIVKVRRIRVSGSTLTAVGYFAINVVRYSTATTGGTSTTLVNVQNDTTDPAATAVVKAYTAVPTDGNLVGVVASWRSLWQATSAAAAGQTQDHLFTFGEASNTRGLVLRGTAQEIALRFPVVLASAGTLAVDVEWTEEV